ncbi:MAG: PDZ domain-containing protein [Planctomycetales bacterium]|nr:PDZ domain-containing protein [Planctomycetales bacterium]
MIAVTPNRRRSFTVTCFAIIALVASCVIAEEVSTLPPLWQRTPQPMDIKLRESFFKHHALTLKNYAPLISTARKSTLRVKQDEKQVALATAFTDSGFVATKFSELDETKPIQCETWDGKSFTAKLTDVSKDWDLALLKLETELTPIAVTDAVNPQLGTFLASVDTADKPFSIGTVSVLPRALLRGFLGIQMTEKDGVAGVIVEFVMRNSAAQEAGVKRSDVVTSVNGVSITGLDQLRNLIGSHRPGDAIKINVTRDENELEMEAVLQERPNPLPEANRAMGIPTSKKRTGFPRVLQHDLFVYPHQCGGPIVDLDGRVVGINIARYDRVTSYAIPIDEIPKLLDEDQNGHVRFARPLRLVKADLSAAEAAVKKSREELEANLKRLQELQSENERAQSREAD